MESFASGLEPATAVRRREVSGFEVEEAMLGRDPRPALVEGTG